MPAVHDLNTVFEQSAQIELVLLIGAVAGGLVLWLLGRKLARPGCAACGLVLGGLAGFILAQQTQSMQWLFALVMGGAIGGCLLAWFLFRLWMGISAAVILGLSVPAAVLVWQGVPVAPATQEARVADAEAANQPLEFEANAADVPARDGGGVLSTDVLAALDEAWRKAYDEQAAAVRRFWDGLGSGAQWTMITASAAGASFGLIAGLLAPYFAAAVQSSLVGGLLMLGGAIRLSATHLPEQAGFLPTGLRGRLLLLGLITLAGLAIQWTLARQRTDK